MKHGQDILLKFPNLTLIHQKIPGREVGQHSHKEHELFLPLQGEIRVYGDDFDVSAGPGKMLYVPPNLEHRFSSSAYGAGERVILLFSGKLWKKVGGGKHAPSALPMHSLIRELVFYMLMHPEKKDLRSFIEALTQSLVDQLQTIATLPDEQSLDALQSKISDKRVQKAIKALKNVDSQPTMAELARQSGLSTRNLNRIFLSEVGMVPKQFAIVMKIQAAKQLLKNSKLTVTDVALEVGYASLSKFIAAFQRHTGVLPSEFRKIGLKR